MIWNSLLYSWLAMTNLVTTGQVWYASPRAHGDLRAVDEIEILLGSSERCLATATNATGHQSAPMEYIESIRGTNGMITVTNALTWMLASKGMLTSNDASFKLAIPYYMQTNTVTNYTTNMLMHTFTGMVDSLGIGFSNWPYQVEYTNYEDRYKMLNFMEWTKRDGTVTNMEYWLGTGQYETNNATPATNGYALAYSAAVVAYTQQWSGASNLTFVQDCYKRYWLETNNVGSNAYQTNLVVTTVSNYVITVAETNMFFTNSPGSLIVTNYIVTGTMTPDVTGKIFYADPDLPRDRAIETNKLFNIFYGDEVSASYIYFDGLGSIFTSETASATGVYYPVTNFGVSGIATVEVYSVTDLWPTVDTGLYTNNGAGSWYLGDHYISPTTNIADCSYIAVDPDNDLTMYVYFAETLWVLYHIPLAQKALAGSASWWPVTNIVFTNNPVDPSGTFTPTVDFESKPAWTNGAWSVVYSNGWYYITTNTSELSPAWKLETESAGADSPGLTYSNIEGTGITGTATVVYNYLYAPVYQTNIIYYCALEKYGADYWAHTTTSVNHRLQGFYVFGAEPSGATSNEFTDYGLGFTNGAWVSVSNTADYISTNERSVYFGGDLSTAPTECEDASETFPSVREGFRLDVAPRMILDWNFLYCTNRYW